MNKPLYRARALDAFKPMPIYVGEELPDFYEYSAINRSVPQMPTGMEKEEESEHHLQRAMVTGLVIPTPDVSCLPDKNDYDRLYPATFKVPKKLIHIQSFMMDQDVIDYDMDSEDENWINAQNKKYDIDITPCKFEEIIDKLEKNSTHSIVTHSEARLLLKDDHYLVLIVYDYWLNKRIKTQTPLLLVAKSDGFRIGNNCNPYIAFRKRVEKMQTRKNRKNDETSYEKMLKLKQDLSRAVTLLDLIKKRENSKRELIALSIKMYEQRYYTNDFDDLLNEVSSLKPVRSVFAPIFTNQNSINNDYSSSWIKDSKSISPFEKSKQQKRKIKQKTNLNQIVSKKQITNIVSSTIPENDKHKSSFPHLKHDSYPFDFHRKNACSYHAPILNGVGNWPWCGREQGGMGFKKFRYSLTALASPKFQCIGYARRRIGRGGRVILDRTGSNPDKYWESMDFTILDGKKKLEHDEKVYKNLYSPKVFVPDTLDSNYFTVQVEDLLDLSTSDLTANIEVNRTEVEDDNLAVDDKNISVTNSVSRSTYNTLNIESFIYGSSRFS
uniref:Enhancer of polycomb-like protein n=1 Tax=Clastoptera arizonana TaxID=38151 RepID=A0A1B6C911_9HEMI